MVSLGHNELTFYVLNFSEKKNNIEIYLQFLSFLDIGMAQPHQAITRSDLPSSL